MAFKHTVSMTRLTGWFSSRKLVCRTSCFSYVRHKAALRPKRTNRDGSVIKHKVNLIINAQHVLLPNCNDKSLLEFFVPVRSGQLQKRANVGKTSTTAQLQKQSLIVDLIATDQGSRGCSKRNSISAAALNYSCYE